MIFSETYTPVLIVGAGPSGLMMAAQLLRHGVQPLIIDSKQGPTTESKALAVQARSLEIYRQMGVIDRVMENGKAAGSVVFNEDGRHVAGLSLADAGKGQTAFPFILMFQQSKNETLLLDFLTLNCCPVYWETSLISLNQTENHVLVELKQAGQIQTITCDYVVGADGAHSEVRRQVQIPFNGDTYSHRFYLADVQLDNPELKDNEVHLCFERKGFAAFFPMPEANRYRIIGNLPDDFIKTESLKLDDLLPYLKQASRIPLTVAEDYWFTTYKLHHRMADSFRSGRCFLIGDAAHIHSPVGGQGLNTGLQDACNLAWKLAGVVNRQLDVKILDTYNAERMPVARSLLRTTDRAFTLIMSRSWLSGLFKKWIMPKLLNYVWSKQEWQAAFFKRVSQISIGYRDSTISLHLSNATKIKAGDRLPYLKVFDEKRQEETDLHEWCNKPGFTFIVLGKLSEMDLFTLAKWITQTYSPLLNFFYLPYSSKNKAVFEAFEVNPNKGKSLIVRPDMHIGFINDKADMFLMDNYLKNIIGVL